MATYDDDRALIVVDVQRDFVDGSMAVTRGFKVARMITWFVWNTHPDLYTEIVTSQCWHPDTEFPEHFADEPDMNTTFHRHCVAGTPGAELHPELGMPRRAVPFLKGQDGPAFSAFEGKNAEGMMLEQYLDSCGVGKIDVVGIATDFCVAATAIDAAEAGYCEVHVLPQLCAPVTDDGEVQAMARMATHGVSFAYL